MGQSKLFDVVKADVAVAPVSLASTNITGAWHNLRDFRQNMFSIVAAAMADTKTVVAQVLKAKDAIGTGSVDLTNSTVTITSPTNVTKATVTATTVVDEDNITINGQIFSAEDTAPDATKGEYATGANDTAAMANLATVVNKLLGTTLLAASSTNVLTLTAVEPGDAVISISAAAGTLVPAAVEAQALIEVLPDVVGDTFTHIALKLTTDATIVVGATLHRGNGRFTPEQKVAASKTDVAA